MKYKPLSERVEAGTLKVTVLYTAGAKQKTVEVSVFRPKTKEDVILAIKNMGQTLIAEYQAALDVVGADTEMTTEMNVEKDV